MPAKGNTKDIPTALHFIAPRQVQITTLILKPIHPPKVK